ncbi:GH92 family glycosyl hydrolase [Pedobacter sp. GSP4]|uniref:GH92 family glycosyl hydrolase n=1 Tax=Pedobacter sp. GSP4 TaxID=3453716 RepID=UPI003EE834CF
MKLKTPVLLVAFISLLLFPAISRSQQSAIWEIGKKDNSAFDMALAPGDYKRFLEKDFGWEDRYFIVGGSDIKTEWPYVLPGPDDSWGGTGPTSGLRSHQINALFTLKALDKKQPFKLTLNILDHNSGKPALLKISVNGKAFKYRLTGKGNNKGIEGDLSNTSAMQIAIPLTGNDFVSGGNTIQFTILEGSWLVFDNVKLEGKAILEEQHGRNVYIRGIKSATYTLKEETKKIQPLLIDIERLKGHSKLSVELDGKAIFNTQIDTGRYNLEVPMPSVNKPRNSMYKVFADGKLISSGNVARNAYPLKTPADYVDTSIGTAHSRWMIAPGPWMPFSMVKLSPDNQNPGWMAGYDPTIESIGTFSHIHEWTMAGLGMMPVNGPLKLKIGDEYNGSDGYRSKIDKNSVESPAGYYKVVLKDYGIKAELTANTRTGFQRYSFPKNKLGRVMVDLRVPAEYDYDILGFEIKKVSATRLEGFSKQHTPDAWSGGVDQDYTLHFVIEFDRPIAKFGSWINGKEQAASNLVKGNKVKDAGVYVEFNIDKENVVQARSAISLVSIQAASNNLDKEIAAPFGWDFEKVRKNQSDTWNKLFSRLAVSSDDAREKTRFYNNMYRGLASRNIWSDADGGWIDASEKLQHFANPNDVALGCDAFWNTFWNLNQYWNLVTPEWSSKWVKSQLAMYDSNGWLAKGPAGMEYIPVMVAEHEIPLIVGAYQMGIRDYDVQKAFAATYKMQTTLPDTVGKGMAGNDDLATYLQHKFVPYDKGRFSNSLEYSYDDWTVGQFAKALGKEKEYKEFNDRGSWWKNSIDPEIGYARMRKSDGSWQKNFDPFKSGANKHYVEGNAWQLTFFVPQDVRGLAGLIGEKKFTERLEWGFNESYKWRFNAPNDAYWDYPIMQGNQQSMHFAFLFNWVGKPWLTQNWSRSIIDRYYGYEEANAYLGDEDQGQMSAWFIMASLGLFQTDGGTAAEPIYELGSPIFPKVVINLGKQYGRGEKFVIEARNTSRTNRYIQSAVLNGKKLDQFWFKSAELLKGGTLVLEMGDKPNTAWGTAGYPSK